jgi:5-(carboxyamino)imidazole ribonucleotide mutase
MQPLVGIIMGSVSDWDVMQKAAHILEELQVPFEVAVVSAHRTPEWMARYASEAQRRGLRVIIAGAGGAAHLPGMTAAHTILPVIGVPVKSSQSLDGWDSILSIVQMPAGVPVATVALNNALNAGLLAASILALTDEGLGQRLAAYKKELQTKVFQSASGLTLRDFKFGRLCTASDMLHAS